MADMEDKVCDKSDDDLSCQEAPPTGHHNHHCQTDHTKDQVTLSMTTEVSLQNNHSNHANTPLCPTDSDKCTSLDTSENSVNDSVSSLDTLRKDDSGISMEQSRHDSDLSQNESEAVAQSISHISVSSSNDCPAVDAETDSNDAVFKMASSSLVDSDDESDADIVVRKTLRCHRRVTDTSTDSDNDDNDDDDDKSPSSGRRDKTANKDSDDEFGSSAKSESDDDSDIDLVDPGDVTSRPKHNWYALQELRRREYGWANRKVQDAHFRMRTAGSLQMVQRLKQQYRMELHEGCVNALHFNRIGKYVSYGAGMAQI